MLRLVLLLIVLVLIAEAGGIAVPILLQLRELRHAEQRLAHGWVSEAAVHLVFSAAVALWPTASIIAASSGVGPT